MGDLLTPRQADVLAGIVRGLTDKEIGAEMGVSFETVRVHARALRQKIGARNRVEAAMWAMRNGGEPHA